MLGRLVLDPVAEPDAPQGDLPRPHQNPDLSCKPNRAPVSKPSPGQVSSRDSTPRPSLQCLPAEALPHQSHVGSAAWPPEDGAHPALASRRAISDTPDALTAALPRHSPSRLGR